MASTSAVAAGNCPPSFICPLTLEIMSDPVTAADGHSYESEAIRTWFKTSNMSPLTGLPMQSKKLIPSHALRNAIVEFQQHPQPARTAPAPPRPAIVGPAAPASAGNALKLILMGDSGIGKTSLVHRVVQGEFAPTAPTIGCSFCVHAVPLPDGGKMNLAIWDTAGQEKYRAFTKQYFRGASAVLACYDISSKASFEGAQRWVQDAQQQQLAPPPIMALVGTKCDLEASRQVSRETAAKYAEAQSMLCLECSAKQGTLVEAVFQAVARVLQQRGYAKGGPTPQGGQQTSLTLDGNQRPVAQVPACCV